MKQRYVWSALTLIFVAAVIVIGIRLAAGNQQAPAPAATPVLDTTGYRALLGPYPPIAGPDGGWVVEQRFRDDTLGSVAVVYDGVINHVTTAQGAYPRCRPATHSLRTAFAATDAATRQLGPSDYRTGDRAVTEVEVGATMITVTCWTHAGHS